MKKYEHRNKKIKNNKDKTFTGTVQGSDKGYAFIIPDGGFDHDFFVPRHSVNGAFHGDKVLAGHVHGTKDEAYIIKILERATAQVVGTFSKQRNCAYVYPDNVKQPEVYIPLNLSLNAKDGDKVLCEITSYPKNKAPGGRVLEVLGESGELEAEEISLIRAYSLEEEFSENALSIAREVSAETVLLNGREDLRQKLIITIDGEDTRDIDDGVSLEMRGADYVLGVHIADVSHYVKPKTALDNEAYARGTSVYFPDRVLPMLPKELSNGACSLNEGEDRYALSCEMVFTPDGERKDYRIFKSVIKSRHRTTYTEITDLLAGEDYTVKKLGDIKETAEKMQALCLALERKRDEAGCVNLDVKEAHIYVNGEGQIVIPPAERMISQRIIEQFMISANEAVAEFLEKKNAPCLYRIHESPSPEKAGNFFSFLKDLGINAKFDVEDLSPADFQ
ncbi:MAG: RNB domain-containing ribonuclease, partial [Clostridia bacterium]|nr:RNB domain-containing ribonuclease [Clostridia bacterium]